MCKKMCEGCPFNFFSDKADYYQNLGCLPAPYDIIKDMKKEDKNWACHDKPDKICRGLVGYVHDMNKPINFHMKKSREESGVFIAKLDYSKGLLTVEGIHK